MPKRIIIVKKNLKNIMFVLFFCLAVSLTSGVAFSEPAKWWYDYDKGITLAKGNGKKVFINFYADWCGFCRRMDMTTFKNPAVVDYLNKNFVPVKVNVDKEKRVAALYKVESLPTFSFTDKNGKQLDFLIKDRNGKDEKRRLLAGYIPAEMLVLFLKYWLPNKPIRVYLFLLQILHKEIP